MAVYKPLKLTTEPASIPQIVAHIQKSLTEENPNYEPLKQWMQPASIPQIVAHIQKYLADNPIPYGDELGDAIEKYLTEHPDVLQVPVVVGATASTDGTEGLVPKPLAGDQTKVLYGDGTFKTIPTPEPPDVMVGATDETDGESGLVPQPLAGDQSKVLYGDGTFKAIPPPEPPVIPVMEGATAETDGVSGLVPQPLAGDQTKVLYGDGTFKTIQTPEPPVMEGATSETDGESGLVPQPLAGDQTKVLYGDGTFKTIPTPEPPSVMDGATASTDGESGLVPQPLAGDQTKVLFGDGNWRKTWDEIRISIASSDWITGQDWPDNIIPSGLSSYSTCFLATKTSDYASNPINSAEGDTFIVNDYNQYICPSDIYIYVGTGVIYAATINPPTSQTDLAIKGFILHN